VGMTSQGTFHFTTGRSVSSNTITTSLGSLQPHSN